MTVLRATAHAKLNLTLDVLNKRPDGYHDLRMVMQEIALGDEITLTLNTGEGWRVTSESGEIPCDARNLAVKAAKLFFETAELDPYGLTIDIKKVTPVMAGMGGGSADGAAVLRLLQKYYGNPLLERTLYHLAEETGSDVPFALFGGTALAEGKGQVLTRLPAMPDCRIVLCKPAFPVSTPALFRAVDPEELKARPDTNAMLTALEAGSLSGIAAALGNVFAPIIFREHPEMVEIQRTLLEYGALGVAMTGSGPTMFGLFSDEIAAEAAYSSLKQHYADTFLTEPV